MKRLTHAISARPSGPTLGAVAATYKEVVPRAPCSIVAALAILKHTATCKGAENTTESVPDTDTQETRTQICPPVSHGLLWSREFFQTCRRVSFQSAALDLIFPCEQTLNKT